MTFTDMEGPSGADMAFELDADMMGESCPASVNGCRLAMQDDACVVSAEFKPAEPLCEDRCEYTYNTLCEHGDGCCPQGCSSFFDDDCQTSEPVCGNDVVEPGEQCDGDCPMSDADCDDFNACTTDSVMGDAAMCQAMCVSVPITACVDNDGCCAPGCAGQDDDCVDVLDACGVPVTISPDADPVTVVSSFGLAPANVGFDFDGDGDVDNEQGLLVEQLGSAIGFTLEDNRMTYEEAIASGELVLLLEHKDLAPGEGAQTFDLEIWPGEPQCFDAPLASGGNFYAKDSRQPMLTADAVYSSGGSFQARSGQGMLPIYLFGLRLQVQVEQLRIQANVDASRSELPGKGLALTDGVMGGYVKVDSYINALNRSLDACDCNVLSDGRPFFSGNWFDGYEIRELDLQGLMCRQPDCELVIKNGRVFTALSILADINSRNPEQPCEYEIDCDSISATFEFQGAGARIVER